MAPQVDLKGSKQVMAVDATDAATSQFHASDGERELDFQSFMEGTPVSQGGQHDMTARGLTTDVGHFNQPPDTTSYATFTPEPLYVQQPNEGVQPPPQEDQRWKKLYGDSENEKGELRRALQAQLDMNAQLMQQVQQAVLNGPPPNPYPTPHDYSPQGYNAPPQYAHYSQVPPQVGPQGPVRFVQKPDGEMVYAEDLERTLVERVAPAWYNTDQRAQQALHEVAQMRQLLFEQSKAQAGITPQLETQALIDQPWLRNLRTSPDPTAYLGALTTYKQAYDAKALVQRTTPPPPPPSIAALTAGTAASAARRVTYVEPGNPSGVTFEPNQGQTDFQRDMAEAMREPHPGKKGARMREVFARYGVGAQNDWRDPSVVTR